MLLCLPYSPAGSKDCAIPRFISDDLYSGRYVDPESAQRALATRAFMRRVFNQLHVEGVAGITCLHAANGVAVQCKIKTAKNILQYFAEFNNESYTTNVREYFCSL